MLADLRLCHGLEIIDEELRLLLSPFVHLPCCKPSCTDEVQQLLVGDSQFLGHFLSGHLSLMLFYVFLYGRSLSSPDRLFRHFLFLLSFSLPFFFPGAGGGSYRLPPILSGYLSSYSSYHKKCSYVILFHTFVKRIRHKHTIIKRFRMAIYMYSFGCCRKASPFPSRG